MNNRIIFSYEYKLKKMFLEIMKLINRIERIQLELNLLLLTKTFRM